MLLRPETLAPGANFISNINANIKCRVMVVMAYNFPIEENEKYGSNRNLVCESTFDCNAKVISKNVIITLTWKADIFKPYLPNIHI